MARVDLDKVTKIYPGGVKAVAGIDLQIMDRELVVLVGPSGCGKSTTLRMIAGLEEITSGTIRIGDRVVNDVAPKDRDIAMVFQNYALYPHMTVYKNMAFALKLRRVARAEIERRVRGAAKILEIEHLLDRRPKELSGGQRQRVAVGRAIVREPAAFLFDEPLSNLDAKLRVTTRAELKRLHQRLKTTTIYVTHDQEEAMTLGDRIVVMRDGVIQQAQTPLETYNKPVNRFVAGFIGMPPMNFFDGALSMVDGQMTFEEGKLDVAPGGGRLTLPGNGLKLSAPREMWEKAGAVAGRQVVLGIRPEHLYLKAPEPAARACAVEMKVNVVEPLGHEMDVYMETDLQRQVVARVEAESGLKADGRVTVYADVRKAHFFEPGEAGMNLGFDRTAASEAAAGHHEPAHALA